VAKLRRLFTLRVFAQVSWWIRTELTSFVELCVCVCVYRCICIHIYIHSHTHTHTHTHTLIYIYIERERERERQTDRKRGSRSRVIGIGTRLRDGRSVVRIPLGASYFLVLRNVQTNYGAYAAFYCMVPVKVKLKFTQLPATKAQRGSTGIATFFF